MSTDTPMTGLPPDSHRLEQGHHPTPFSAAQIRDASNPGTTIAFRIERPGADPYLERWEFLGGDDAGGTRRRWAEALDGTPIEDPTEIASPWIDLQRHASYPSATTRLTTGRASTPAGDFDCWIYVIANDDGSITTASFAHTEPGPPVLLETRRDGVTVFRMALVGATRT